MASSNNQKPKTSRVAKISVKPVWRRKLDQPLPTSNSHPNNSSQQNQPNIISFSTIPPQNSYPNNSTILSQQDEFTITLTNKLPNDPFGENAQPHQHLQQNTHPITSTPPSPSLLSEQSKFDDELKEAHELNALLALHLTQQQLDQQTTPSPNLIQFENHIQNCICCNYLQQQSLAINEHLTWIEHLLSKTSPPSSSNNPSIPNPSP